MKTYTITLDTMMKELVLTALMEKAYACGESRQAKDNYIEAYRTIKEQLKDQEK